MRKLVVVFSIGRCSVGYVIVRSVIVRVWWSERCVLRVVSLSGFLRVIIVLLRFESLIFFVFSDLILNIMGMR